MTNRAERVAELMKRKKPDVAEDYAALEEEARRLGYSSTTMRRANHDRR